MPLDKTNTIIIIIITVAIVTTTIATIVTTVTTSISTITTITKIIWTYYGPPALSRSIYRCSQWFTLNATQNKWLSWKHGRTVTMLTMTKAKQGQTADIFDLNLKLLEFILLNCHCQPSAIWGGISKEKDRDIVVSYQNKTLEILLKPTNPPSQYVKV